ncbi:hypothetical protein DPEC_G00244510 [Dallia pectoralis]|uniref:Uncharacterized protein n=1 Tax=Dallia pectoralis TaxID=75939 RepID=A0ACC2FVV5_DALPE|nr:hypothetical protein DPEC_G00244510 [Dallia pectoralis]
MGSPPTGNRAAVHIQTGDFRGSVQRENGCSCFCSEAQTDIIVPRREIPSPHRRVSTIRRPSPSARPYRCAAALSFPAATADRRRYSPRRGILSPPYRRTGSPV